ncbi:MAG: HAD-IA family hydrolase [Polyangiaceae bacterium]|nr:HAD-IA family hydrolase [Polyangiaceae bacterium]
MNSSQAFRAWLVDLDGTLYHRLPVQLACGLELAFGGGKARRTVMRFRAEHENMRRALAEADELASTLDSGDQNDDDQNDDDQNGTASAYEIQLQGAANALGISTTELRGDVELWMHQKPGRWIHQFRRRELLSEIEYFRATGGRTALVSDYPARDKLASLGVASLFDTVVANGEPGGPSQLKPAPEGYLRAARALDINPSECLVIGDRDDADGQAARAAGMSFRLIR